MPKPISPASESALKTWMPLVVALGLGICLRLAFPQRIAVEHFDEGVYASSAFIPEQFGGTYPMQYLYAPPLIPWIIKVAVIMDAAFASNVRLHSITPALPSLIFGTATIVAIYFAASYWFDRAGAIAAAFFASTSDLHILLSRTALTDVMMMFTCLVALIFFERAVSRARWPYAVIAGLATAACWWTKYNGWLPLAITLSGAAGMLVMVRPARPALRRIASYWMLMAIVAMLGWLPCLIALQDVGGYSVVAANHQRYVNGFSQWATGTINHLHNSQLLASPVAVLGAVAAAWILAGAAIKNAAIQNTTGITARVIAALTIACFCYWAFLPTLICAALIGAGSIVFESVSGSKQSNMLGKWLVMAWFFGLALSTPVYQTYPRLLLPFTVAVWLLAPQGIAVVLAWAMRSPKPNPSSLQSKWVAGVIALLIVGLAIGIARRAPRFHAWDSRVGLLEIADKVAARTASSPPDTAICVNGEPALYYQLCAVGKRNVAPVQGMESLQSGQTVFYLVGPHALNDPEFQQRFRTLGDRVREVARFDYTPSMHVQLNAFRNPHAINQVRLYQSTAEP